MLGNRFSILSQMQPLLRLPTLVGNHLQVDTYFCLHELNTAVALARQHMHLVSSHTFCCSTRPSLFLQRLVSLTVSCNMRTPSLLIRGSNISTHTPILAVSSLSPVPRGYAGATSARRQQNVSKSNAPTGQTPLGMHVILPATANWQYSFSKPTAVSYSLPAMLMKGWHTVQRAPLEQGQAAANTL